MAEEDADRHVHVGMTAQGLLEQQAGLAGGQRHQEAGAGVAFVEQRGGGDIRVGEVAHLGLPAARQEGEHRAARGDLQGLAHGLAVGREGKDIGQRVPHVAHRHARRPVQLGLEGKQAQHVAHRAGDALQTPLAPSPDRRADEVDRRDAAILEALLEPQAEVGGIDADEGGRRIFLEQVEQAAADARQLTVVFEGIDVAMHGELLGGPEGLEADRLHLGAADAEELGIRQVALERLDQVAGEEVAGRLARHHGDAQGHGSADDATP